MVGDEDDKYSKKRSPSFIRSRQALVAGLLVLGLLALWAPTDGRSNALGAGDAVAENAGDLPVSSEDGETIKEYPRYEGMVSNDIEELPSDDPELAERSHTSSNDEENEQELTSDGYDERDEGRLFEDQEAFDNAPVVKVLPESKTRKYSKIVLMHERYHRDHPSRLYVPRLRKDTGITAEKFRRIFMEKSQPVIVPFDAMRHLNFTSKGFTLEEMKEIYPNSNKALYKYGTIQSNDIDLGPAISELMEDKKLRKTSSGKSYPRNTKINLSALHLLNVQRPPLIPDIPIMLPSLWFGPTSAATPLHSDCCDNWAVMIAGTKRWTVAPPSEARILKPNCKGGLCWVKRLPHADEHAETREQQKIRDSTQFVTFDLHAGEMLFLPAGWFHHVENVGGTVMINFWSKNGPEFLKYVQKLS